MRYNYNKLRGRMIEYFGGVKCCASKIGLSSSNFSQKLNSRRCFTQKDIEKLMELLDIPASEVGEYFFCKQV